MFSRNTGANLVKVTLTLSLTVPFVALVVIGALTAHGRQKRLLLVGLAYLPLYLIFGLWHEVRLLLAVVPFVLPAGLSFLQEMNRVDQPDPR